MWVLSTLFLILGFGQPSIYSAASTSSEKCEAATEDASGHALLATNVRRTRVMSEELPIVGAVSSQGGKPTLRAAELEEIRATMAKSGNVTPEQLRLLLEVSSAAIARDEKEMEGRNTVLLDSRVGGNSTVNVSEASAAGAVREPDWDYIEDDQPMFFPRERKSRPTVVPKRSESESGHEAAPASQSVIPDGHDKVEKKHVMALFVVVPIAFVFFAVFTFSNVMEKYEITAIPESGILIAVGVVLGVFIKMYAQFDFFEDADAFAEMNAMILNLMLLPIIIFASGWAIRRQDFYSQFPYILLFAGVGVGLSTFVIACLIRFSGQWGLHGMTRWRTAFAYASLISATDPVATLSTYAKLKVDPLLNIMVFGESIINDAVAIVAFGIFNDDDYMVDNKTGETLSSGRLLYNLVYGVLKIFGGSALLGCALGAIYTLIAHWADMRNNKKGQILNIFAASYLTYALAESVAMSGIIAEMFCALLMGVYMRPHLSTEGSVLATFFVKQVAALADAAVCLLIGVSVVQLSSKGWYFGLWTMLFCLIGRFTSVVPVALIANSIKRVVAKAQDMEPANLLEPKHMFMMWHAGLRGAIALALSLELGEWVDRLDGAGSRHALQTATFFLICVFLLVFGGSTSTMLKRLNVETGKDHPPDYLSKSEDLGPLRGFLKWLDTKFLSPLLIGKAHDHGKSEDEMDVEELLKQHHHHH